MRTSQQNSTDIALEIHKYFMDPNAHNNILKILDRPEGVDFEGVYSAYDPEIDLAESKLDYDVDRMLNPNFIRYVNDTGTLMHFAVTYCRKNIIEKMIDKGAPIKNSLLLSAFDRHNKDDRLEVIDLLISKGANPLAQFKDELKYINMAHDDQTKNHITEIIAAKNSKNFAADIIAERNQPKDSKSIQP